MFYPAVEAWLRAWLQRSLAEWVTDAAAAGQIADTDPAWLARCRGAVESVLADVDDPMLLQYPLPHDKLWMALAALELRAAHVPEAEAAIERAVGLSREPDGTRAVGRCLVAAGDAPALLAAADAGLGVHNLGFLTELRLLRFRKDALERLERWSDADAVVQIIADHCKWDLDAQRALVWVRMGRNEIDLAADRLIDTAQRGVGCDRDAPLADRVRGLVDSMRSALREPEMTDRAAALDTVLLDKLRALPAEA